MHPEQSADRKAQQETSIVQSSIRQFWAVALVLVLGLAFTLFLFLRVQSWQEDRLQAYFAAAANDNIKTLETSIEANLETSHYMRGLYEASGSVSREEFRTFVSGPLARHSNIQALGWSPRVLDSERDAYEATTQEEGYPDFHFTERDAAGQLQIAQQRGEYFPVYYIEPLEKNQPAFGFDLRSAPSRWETMQQARDSGALVVTSRLVLVQESGDQFGVITYLPVYQNGTLPATVEERREKLRGFISVVLRVGDMVELALDRTHATGMHIYLSDESAPEEEQHLYLYGSEQGTNVSERLGHEASEFQVSKEIEVGGRIWKLTAVATDDFAATYRGSETWVVLGSGLIVTLLTAGYLFSSLRKNEQLTVAARNLGRRSTQLQVAAEVARDSTSTTHELDELLNRAASLICSRFGFYHAGIFLVDSAGEYAVLRAAASEAAPAMLAAGHKLKVGETGIVGYVTHTGLPRIALDVGADGVYFKNPYLPHTRSEMALPLKVGEQIIGALDVQSEEEAAFDEQDIAALQTMADQIAIAIQNIHSYQRVLELDNLKTRFIANMSHELRTPLNAIIGFSEFLISQTYGGLNAQQENLLERILTNGEHLLGLINDILDLSKIEAGKLELLMENVKLSGVLEGVMSTAIGLGKDKNLKLTLDLPLEELPLVWADQSRVRQVLLNLLSNAVKFTPAGGSVSVRAMAQNGTVTISVQDTGIGIAPENQKLVFEEFRQVDSDMNREYQGTGLGLPICKRLIEMQGGTLTLMSASGQGSTFTFTLPVSQTAAPLHEKGLVLTSGESLLSATEIHGRLVVVDDDPDAQTLLRHTLERAGWEVHSVFDSHTALDVIQEVKPDLIVLDIQMYPMDGWDVLRQLRADPDLALLPVVICSIVDPVKGQIGVVNGVQGWIVKPVDRQELLSQVKRVAAPSAQVLVVDDDEDARLVVRSILEQSGWQVTEAHDGEQALVCLAESRPDLVVLDLMMPKVDGFEVLQRMSGIAGHEHTPVIVLTAKDLSVEESQWLSTHTQGYFQKAAFPITSFPNLVRSLVKPRTGQQKSTNGKGSHEAGKETIHPGEA